MSEFLDSKEHEHFVPAPKAGTGTSATDGTVRKKNITSAAVVEFDLSEWVGKWCTIRTETADAGWFVRAAGSSVDPLLAARVGSNDGRQCERQVAGDPARAFIVEADYPELAVIGSASGVCCVALADVP